MNKLSAPIPSCGDSSCEMMISPFPVPRTRPLSVRRVAGRREVVFFDANKPNSRTILEKAAVLLRARGVEVSAPITSKADPSRPASPDILDRLARHDALIICGVAD